MPARRFTIIRLVGFQCSNESHTLVVILYQLITPRLLTSGRRIHSQYFCIKWNHQLEGDHLDWHCLWIPQLFVAKPMHRQFPKNRRILRWRRVEVDKDTYFIDTFMAQTWRGVFFVMICDENRIAPRPPYSTEPTYLAVGYHVRYHSRISSKNLNYFHVKHSVSIYITTCRHLFWHFPERYGHIN